MVNLQNYTSAKIPYTVVIPAYNESQSIRKVLAELKLFSPDAEIIVVDDCSSDGTPDVVREFAGVRLIRHPVNRGAVNAVMTGLKAAAREVVVTMDADGQHPARLVPEIAGLVAEDQVDVVLGVRPDLPRLGERLIARSAGVSDATTGFRALKRNQADLLAGDRAFGGMFIVRAKKRGLRICEYPIPVYPRAAGKSFHSSLRVLITSLWFLFWFWFRPFTETILEKKRERKK